MTSKRLIIIAAVVFGLAVIGGAVAYAEIVKPAWIFKPKATATPKPTATPSPTLGASITPSPSPAVPPIAVRDAQRQAILAAYAAGYKATAKNGFYPTAPPAVTVPANDPTTGQPYVVTKTVPTTIGQIHYWPGGSCTGPGVTPGLGGSRYLALQIVLEGSATPYCIDVK
jgi:hypothetical protein